MLPSFAYRYRGYYFDTETGFYYLQSRYYDPEAGRFLNADDAMFTMSINGNVLASNLCSYCCNDVINSYDPTGMNKIHNFLTKANRWFLSHGINTAAFAALVLNMRKDRYGVYHANFNCWQQYFGYNDLYDLVFNIGTSMRSKKFPFSSGGKSYILWAWKGDYINLGAGAELGIYYGGAPHWKVDKKLAMNMSMTLKYKGRRIISYSAKTWWITGFHPKYLNVNASNLTASFTVKFNTLRMYQDFAARYKKSWSCNSRTRSSSYTF